jgi:hypothetical protein
MAQILNVVHTKDVENLFVGLGLLNSLVQGEIRCHICGDRLSAETFRAVTRQEGNLLFFCTKSECYADMFSAGEKNG